MTRMLVEVALIERKLRGAALGSVNRWHENHYFISSPCWRRHGKTMEGHLLSLGVKFVKEILGCFEEIFYFKKHQKIRKNRKEKQR